MFNYSDTSWYSFIGFQCSYCDTILTKENFSKDHVIAKAARINFGWEGNNITVCCKSCNSKKGDRSLLNFLGFVEETIRTKKKTDWSADQKCIYLSNICGLRVQSRKTKGNTEYNFYLDSQQIKSCFTYPKAKLFAEGYSLGKQCRYHFNSLE